MELSYGASFGDEDERLAVRNALHMYPIVEQTDQVAQRAGRLLARADIEAGGRGGIDEVDPMVAAVADRHDEPVLTANIDDFGGLG